MFGLPRAIVERVLATLANVDNTLAEYQLLAREARLELAEISALRKRLQAVAGKE